MEYHTQNNVADVESLLKKRRTTMDTMYDIFFMVDSIVTIILKLMVLVAIHIWIVMIKDPFSKNP